MEHLLDDKNIEGELPSSFLRELKASDRWLLMTAAITIITGGILLLVSVSTLLFGYIFSVAEGLLFSGFGVLGAIFLYFAYVQFRYGRAIQWLESNSMVYTLDDVFLFTHKVWRAVAILFLGIAILLFSVVFAAITPNKMETPQEVPAMKEAVAPASASETIDTTSTIMTD